MFFELNTDAMHNDGRSFLYFAPEKRAMEEVAIPSADHAKIKEDDKMPMITKELTNMENLFSMAADSHAYNKAKSANRRKRNALKHGEDRKHGKQDRYERSAWKECRWIDSSPSAYKSRKANDSFTDELHDEWDLNKSQVENLVNDEIKFCNLIEKSMKESREKLSEKETDLQMKKAESAILCKLIQDVYSEAKFTDEDMDYLNQCKDRLGDLATEMKSIQEWITFYSKNISFLEEALERVEKDLPLGF